MEDLVNLYKDAVRSLRYYLNTDDLDNWNREKGERDKTREEVNRLEERLKQNGLPIPKVD